MPIVHKNIPFPRTIYSRPYIMPYIFGNHYHGQQNTKRRNDLTTFGILLTVVVISKMCLSGASRGL